MNSASAYHINALRERWPGTAISILIALTASYASTVFGGPQLLYALFIGLGLHFLSMDSICRPGIEFCSKSVLRVGVALLGARLSLNQISSLGVSPIAIVLCALVTTIVFGWLIAYWLRRPSTEGILSGCSVAICGASAALAVSAVLPQTKENEKYTLLVVVGVTALSTLAMIVYPLLVKVLGLDVNSAGVFIGGTIHDVAQVVGAAYLISDEVGDLATFVKLLRVACLVPVVVTLSIIFSRSTKTAERSKQPIIPWFLAGFVCLMLINTFGLIPVRIVGGISELSRACLVIAIAALGVKTSLRAIATLGWLPVVMLLAETVWIAVFVLGALLIGK